MAGGRNRNGKKMGVIIIVFSKNDINARLTPIHVDASELYFMPVILFWFFYALFSFCIHEFTGFQNSTTLPSTAPHIIHKLTYNLLGNFFRVQIIEAVFLFHNLEFDLVDHHFTGTKYLTDSKEKCQTKPTHLSKNWTGPYYHNKNIHYLDLSTKERIKFGIIYIVTLTVVNFTGTRAKGNALFCTLGRG